jgi:hypothetical protein
MFKKIIFVFFVFSLAAVANSQPVKPGDQFGTGTNFMKSLEKINNEVSESQPHDSFEKGTNKLHLKLGYQIGYGTYSMESLKNINSQISESLPFDTKIVDNFPGYLYFRPSISLQSPSYGIGLIFTFQSTGSRISAKDYSGEYFCDTKLHSTAPGIYGDINILSQKKSRICFYSMTGLLFSKLKIHEFLSLQNSQVSDQNIDYKAQNYFLEPGLCYSYFLGSFSLGLNAGYFITIGSQAFYSGDNKENTLYDYKKQQDAKPDWNGIRAGFSILFTFKSKQ